MVEDSVSTNVAIVGAGMAGLVTAVQALRRGANVILLEKGHRAGGTMYLSGGALWTYETEEEAREVAPHGDEDLQRIVINSFENGLEWLEEDVGATLSTLEPDVPGKGKSFDPPEFTQFMVDRIEDLGGTIHLETSMKELLTANTGRVVGVAAMSPNGKQLRVKAESVVLATGGFQGNERLLEQHITTHTENLWLRANPWSTGDGLLAALDIGGKSTRGMSHFYGHNMAAPPADFDTSQLADATQYYGPRGITLNTAGERFTDESESFLEETLAQDTAKQADGRGYLVIDRDIYEMNWHNETVGEMVDRAGAFGGRTAECEDLNEIQTILDEWGVNGRRAIKTLSRYNRCVQIGKTSNLAVPRADNRDPINSPPFYVVEVQPGITFTMGGLHVNERMEVLRRTTSSSTISQNPIDDRDQISWPIGGLYAAGVDIGNVNDRHYIGGLALALASGRIVGKNVA
ncbi:FAD-dependent oxidoreductase [Natronorubrum sp. FCH18a]|uniref:FAD-dependent oxidoreductase n=1 Tax=Natronorubrum sp. FCH18a TaxID=3447018 RepID=UPI003F50D6FB